MSQHDYSLANQAGAAFRADANDALAAIVSLNSGATAPATTFARMFWVDTTTGLLKIRNGSNNDWITIGSINSPNLGLFLVKRKTADESVISSTTLQDDNDLWFPIGANEEWVAEFDIFIRPNLSVTGCKVAVTVPAGAVMEAGAVLVGNNGDADQGMTQTSGADFAVGAVGNFTLTTYAPLRVSVWLLNGATPGNVTLQWAQSASSATALTFSKGSHMSAHRVT